MQKKFYQLLTFFILTTISASGYAQNCKFSKEEYNADEETSVTETKSVVLAGLATSVIKIKLGKKGKNLLKKLLEKRLRRRGNIYQNLFR